MRGRSAFLAAPVLALLLFASPALAAGGFSDVPKDFWARPQIKWAAGNGWITPSSQTAFKPRHTVSRLNASKVLVRIAFELKGVPEGADPFAQAVAAGWIPESTGPTGTITQLEFDRALVRILGLSHSAKALNHLQTADGWAPQAPGWVRRRAGGARDRRPNQRARRLGLLGALLGRPARARQHGGRGLPGDAPLVVGHLLRAGEGGRGHAASRLDAAQAQGARDGASLRRLALHLGRHLARPAVAARLAGRRADSTAPASSGGS